MSKQKRLLTKTAFGYGLACDRLFWMYQNAREDLPEPDEATQAIFDQGHLIGNLAKTLYPDGIEIDWTSGHERGIAQTDAVLAEKRPIFEAGFQHGKTHARADILIPAAGGRWDLIEVKSSSAVKEEHLHDVAFQKHVYQGAGLRIDRCSVMHVDKSYVRQGMVDAGGLLARTDVTDEIKPLEGGIPAEVKRQLRVMSRAEAPDARWVALCNDCDLHPRCWAFLPEHNVFSLCAAGTKAVQLMEAGVLRILDIPEDFPLSEKQEIQVRCTRTGEPHIHAGGIQAFLDKLEYPMHFLDFETFMIAVPPFDDMSPYEQVPFQYSLHVVDQPASRAQHFGYLSDGSSDPRPEILESLSVRLGRAGSVVAYNAPFEIRVLESCCRHFPEYAKWLGSVRERFVDLLSPFKSFHYYHPEQKGSASLKAVLPVLTGRSYKELEIADGQAAGLRFREMASGNTTESRKRAIRKALEKYCRQDAEGMIDIIKALQRLCPDRAS